MDDAEEKVGWLKQGKENGVVAGDGRDAQEREETDGMYSIIQFTVAYDGV